MRLCSARPRRQLCVLGGVALLVEFALGFSRGHILRIELQLQYPTETSFLSQLREMAAAGQPAEAHIFDVGANNGGWSEKFATQAAAVIGDAPIRLHLVMMEPQPKFAPELREVASRFNGTLVPALAWTQATDLAF